ncbi:hypothetical protein SAMN05443550_101473 [Pedobacter hartonius]|uniref:Uncharacterized protein n=1 Tax=Pedobacter hartonius TaxID=425514 RepID=A0A1H3X3W6_9SPHI|nr:hypothetical protein SAMN05443550_101473 [Pedobacter hartonius]
MRYEWRRYGWRRGNVTMVVIVEDMAVVCVAAWEVTVPVAAQSPLIFGSDMNWPNPQLPSAQINY